MHAVLRWELQLLQQWIDSTGNSVEYRFPPKGENERKENYNAYF